MFPIDEQRKAEIIEAAKEAPEIQIYLLINDFSALGLQISRMKQQPGLKETTEFYTSVVTALVGLTTRFGIEPFSQKHLSDEFTQWFLKWDTYVKSLLPEGLEELDKKLQAQEDVSMFRPQAFDGTFYSDDPIIRRLQAIQQDS